MSTNKAALIEKAVQSGIQHYISDLRAEVDTFVDQTFSMSEAWEINKKAIGLDMIKAPANVLWTPLYFVLSSVGSGLKKMNFDAAGNKLKALPSGFSTDVEKEVEWRIYSQFLGLPIKQENREFTDNKLLTTILEDESLRPILKEGMQAISDLALNKDGEAKLAENLMAYVDSRKAAAELSSTLIGAATGFLATKSLSLGALGLGQSLAASATFHTAASSFVFGNTLGGLYYSVIPVSASTGALILSTGGVAAILGVVSAFGGVLADPLQKSLGLHQKRLNKLVDALEKQLTSDDEASLALKDGYVARVLDILDFIITVAVKK